MCMWYMNEFNLNVTVSVTNWPAATARHGYKAGTKLILRLKLQLRLELSDLKKFTSQKLQLCLCGLKK